MITDRVTATLTVGATTIAVDLDKAATISLDQGWSPFATAEVTVPASDALASATDPRGMARGELTVRQVWSESLLTLNDLAALPEFAGTLDDLGAAWAGLTLDDVGDLYGDRWGNPTWRPPMTLTANLGVRSCVRDYVADTLALTLMSDERLAQETFPGAQHLDSESLESRMTTLLAYLGTDVPVAVDMGRYAATVPEADMGWTDSVWDVLARSAAAVSFRVWCDERRVWRATHTNPALPETVHLPRVTAAEDAIDRDGDWVDAYRDVLLLDGGGYAVQDVYADGNPAYTGHRKRSVRTHPDGEIAPDPVAAAVLLFGRGRALTLSAPIDLTMRPGSPVTTGLPSLPALSGQVERVRLDLSRAEMTLTTRDTLTGG